MKWLAFVTTCPREDSTSQQHGLVIRGGRLASPRCAVRHSDVWHRDRRLRPGVGSRQAARSNGTDCLWLRTTCCSFRACTSGWMSRMRWAGCRADSREPLVAGISPEQRPRGLVADAGRRHAQACVSRQLAYVFDPPLVDALLEVANFNKQPNRCEYFVATVCKQRHFGYWYYERSLCQRRPHLDHLVMDAVSEVLSPSRAHDNTPS